MDTPTADDKLPALDRTTAAHSTRRVDQATIDGARIDEATIDEDAAAILDAAGISQLSADEGLLTEQQRAILDFERQWWRRPGAKEQAIRETFEMSPTRYYRALNAVLDLPQALRYDAALVNRLLRLRSAGLRGHRLR